MRRTGAAFGTVVACCLLWIVAGCGGGRSGTSGGGGGGGNLPEPVFSSTARTGAGTAAFRVDLEQGTVEVTPLSGSSSGRAVFAGATVTFNSQLALDQPGNHGTRVLNVSLTNRWGVPIGVSPDGVATGLRLVFGPCTNLTGLPDVRSAVSVSTLPGTISGPFGVAVAGDGTIFASSLTGNSLLQFGAGTATTLAGGSVGFADGLGATAAFAYPLGVAFNAADGALYLADYNNRRVRRIERNGRVTTIAGTGTAGTADGPGTTATFQNPLGIATSGGDLLVTDWGAGAIRRLHLAGGDPAVAANWAVSTLVTGLVGPAGIAVGGDGLSYVAEANANRIRQVAPTGAWTVIAGGGAEGNADGYGDTACWALPYGLAWTPSGLVATEYHTNRVRWVRPVGSGAPSDPASWQVLTVAGDIFGTGTTDGTGLAARFNTPKLLAADAAGAVYLADHLNNAVRKLVLPSGPALQGGGSSGAAEPVVLANADGVLANADGDARPYLDYPVGSGLGTGQSTAARPWWFQVPAGVKAFTFTVSLEAATPGNQPPEAASGAGSPKAVVSTLAGQPAAIGLLDGPGPTARFGSVLAVACDGAGNVYVSDFGNHALRRVGRDGVVTTIAGGRGAGATDGPGSVALLNKPLGLVVNGDATVIYLVEYDGCTIRRLSRSAGLDPARPSSWYVATIAGLGATPGRDNGSGTVARFDCLAGICRVTDSLLYVSEYFGNRVRRLKLVGADADVASSWWVEHVAGDNSATTGASGTTDGSGTLARFHSPFALAAGPDGAVYVADYLNHLLRRVLPDGTVSTHAGPAGVVDAGYVDGGPGAARFGGPAGLAMDAAGNLYVAEFSNNRIRRVSPARQVTTVAGGGAGSAWDGPGHNARFYHPNSLAVDASGTLYVGDMGAVRKIERLVDLAP